MSEYTSIGKSVIRKDAYDKATGKAMFTADYHEKGMLYGKLLGSEHPHAIIKSIDTSAAEAIDGVVCIMTGKDVPEERTDGYIHDRHILVKKVARYIGDPIAAVAAVTEEAAEAAVAAIKVEYELLPYELDPVKAREKNCPVVIHEGLPEYDNIEFQGVWSSLDPERPNQFIHRKIRHGKDIDEAMKEADVIIEGEYSFPRAHHCCLEPHVAMARPESDGGVTIYACEQGGGFQRYGYAEALGLESSKCRLVVPYIGGGFGGKVGVAVAPIAAMLALKAQKPVRIEMSREEVFVSGNPRSPGIVKVIDGFKKDGTLVARRIDEVVNSGAYSTHTTVLISAGVYGATGTYRTPNLHIDAYGVYTNTPPTGPYRSLGSEMLCFAIECNMDKAATALGMSQLEIRRKNVLVDGDEDGIGQITENNGTMACLEEAAKYLEAEPMHENEGPWVYGRGYSVGNKFTAYWDTGTAAACKVCDDGTIEIRNFHIEMGQGSMTVDAQVAAEEFKIPVERVKMVIADSAIVPYDEGTYCSRGTYINGNAVRKACQDAKKQMFEVASEIMGIPPYELDTANGTVFERNNPDNFIPFFQLYEYGGYLRKGGEIFGLDTYTTTFDTDDPETGQSNDVVTFYSYGALGFEVGVNVETGEVKILKSGGWYDMGQPINPILVDVQLYGAMCMGLGQAIFEEQLYNDQGKIINGSFRDYKIPTSLDCPRNDQLVGGFAPGVPLRSGPYGAKGIGEVSLVPVMPAIANAMRQALGIDITEIPMTREKILNAIKNKQAAEAK